MHCECTGGWPNTVGVCIILFIPKAEGGYRPFGLLQWTIRLRMRMRRAGPSCKNRENSTSRPHLYAGAWQRSACGSLDTSGASRNRSFPGLWPVQPANYGGNGADSPLPCGNWETIPDNVELALTSCYWVSVVLPQSRRRLSDKFRFLQDILAR